MSFNSNSSTKQVPEGVAVLSIKSAGQGYSSCISACEWIVSGIYHRVEPDVAFVLP